MSKNVKDPQNDPETRKKLLASQKSQENEEIKRILNEMPLDEDTTCGVGCFKGSFLQK